MTTAKNSKSIKASLAKGDRVSAGKGDDADTGTIWEVRPDGTAMVGWDSGVATPADLSSLRKI